jgi:hypothetical protein
MRAGTGPVSARPIATARRQDILSTNISLLGLVTGGLEVYCGRAGVGNTCRHRKGSMDTCRATRPPSLYPAVGVVVSAHLSTNRWPAGDLAKLLRALTTSGCTLLEVRWTPDSDCSSHLLVTAAQSLLPVTTGKSDFEATRDQSRNLLSALEPLRYSLSEQVFKAVLETYVIDAA